MEVILTPENEAALRSYIYEIIIDEIAKARRDASIDASVVKQVDIAKFLNVSTAKIRQWEKEGMPFGQKGSQKFYDKEICKAWVLAQ